MVDDALHSALRDSAARLVEVCSARQLTVSTAESCTAGMVASAIAGIPGASSVLRGGAVTYVNEVKHAVLGVPDDVLAEKGAVSEETACAMAAGARERLGCDVAVSVTGIAGPGGAVPGKPVGTVWIGVASARGTRAALHVFPGGRDEVRARTVRCALEELACEIARTGTQAAK